MADRQSKWTAVVLAFALVGTGGCSTARVYEVRYVEPSRVVVEVGERGISPQRRLEDPDPGASTQILADPVDLSMLGTVNGYRSMVTRRGDAGIEFSFEPSAGEGEHVVLVHPNGELGLEFPTATGDTFDHPGFHLAGVTGLSHPAPMSIQDGVHGLHFEYRPPYDTQQALGRTPQIEMSLFSPLDNVASVQAIEKKPRGALIFLLVTSAVFVAAGVAVGWPRDGQSDTERDLRLGIGIPLFAAGGAALGWSAWELSQPDRGYPIPVDQATGAP